MLLGLSSFFEKHKIFCKQVAFFSFKIIRLRDNAANSSRQTLAKTDMIIVPLCEKYSSHSRTSTSTWMVKSGTSVWI